MFNISVSMEISLTQVVNSFFVYPDFQDTHILFVFYKVLRKVFFLRFASNVTLNCIPCMKGMGYKDKSIIVVRLY